MMRDTRLRRLTKHLGARPGDGQRMIVREGLLLALFGVTPTDPTTFAGVFVVLAGASLLASYLPARKALRVDPVITLRGEG